jgi:signal transduction histidine kinase
VAAAREALFNAAKHAGGAPISLFGEVDEDGVTAYVRDRGPGFDLEAIPADRRGVRDSIVARMVRLGGHAAVRTAPGGGCEVRLVLERKR